MLRPNYTSEQKRGGKVEVNSSNELVKYVQDRSYFFDAIRINEGAPAAQDTTGIQMKKRKAPGHSMSVLPSMVIQHNDLV